MSTTLDRNRWLRWLPDPLKRENLVLNCHQDSEEGSLSVSPLTAVVDGQPWIFASNSSALIFVKDRIDWKEMTPKQVETVRGFVTKEITGSGQKVHFGQFKHWLGRAWGTELPCPRCNGDWAKHCTSCWGVVGKKGDCPRCGIEHECCCPQCEGRNYLYCPDCVGSQDGFPARPGNVEGVVFDRALAARFLACVDSQNGAEVTVLTSHRLSPVWIEPKEKNWRVVIMPLREPEASGVPRWR